MIKYFAEHSTAANIMTIIVIFVGCFFLPQLRRETFPDFESELVEISILNPGASALEIESNIVDIIEDTLSGVDHIAKIKSEAYEGVAKVFVTMKDTGNIDKFIADIRNTVEGIRNFPDEAEKPVTAHFGLNLPVASIAVTGEMTIWELKNFCEKLKKELHQFPQISQIQVEGFSERQIKIQISQEKLLQYNLSISQISNAISAQSIDMPVGKIDTLKEQILIRFTDERKSIQEFENIVVVTGRNGEEILLVDIAQIEDSFKTEENKIIFDGKRAGLLTIYKAKEEDSLRILDIIKTFIATKNEYLPPNTQLVLTQDVSSVVSDRLLLLVTNGWQGLLLVFFHVAFFNFSLAFWVAMGLPVSFLVTFSLMNYIGYSLNMMTMLAMLIALGLIMDDAIVIAENIATHLQRGKKALCAVIDGVNEVKMGVISSFLTTSFVFVPLAFMEGNLGKVLQVIPVVLIIVLFISIFEAFFVLPNHLVHSLHDHKMATPGKLRQKINNAIDYLRSQLLKKLVNKAILYRYATIGILIFIVCLSIATLTSGILKFRAFPDLEGNIVEAQLLLPQGTSFEQTEKVISKISEAFSKVRKQIQEKEKQDIVKNERITFGMNTKAKEQGSHVATISVDLIKSEHRKTLSSEIIELWRNEVGMLPDVVSLNFAQRVLKPAGIPIEILIQGENLEELKKVSLNIQRWLHQFDGVFNISDDLREGKSEILLNLKSGASELGVTASSIAQQLRHSFHGIVIQEIQKEKESYEVELKLLPFNRNQITDLEDFQIKTEYNNQIPLHVLADIDIAEGYSAIKHVHEMRTVTLEGDIDYDKINLPELTILLEKSLFPQIAQEFPHIKISFGGETENSAVTTSSIWRSLIIGTLGIFVLLSFQFKSYSEPIIIMTAIPFSFVGVIVGHFVMGMDLTLPGLLGFASLAGIVVNDSILLVEFIKKQEEGKTINNAAIQASGERFRAVLLTSLTTMAGLFPLLLEKSVQAQVLIPIATSLVFGLLFSTILVLVILPCMYAIIHDFKVVK